MLKKQSCFISVTLKSMSARNLLDPTTFVYCYLLYFGTFEINFGAGSLKMAR